MRNIDDFWYMEQHLQGINLPEYESQVIIDMVVDGGWLLIYR